MKTRTMQITLNGDPAETAAATVAQLLDELELLVPRVAVVQNGEVVPKADFPSRQIATDDVIDIITIIGGG